MQLDVSPQEQLLLLEILQSYRSDLSAEIVRTDNAAYKRELKQEEALLV